MAQFSPQRLLQVLSPATTRRLFHKSEPSFAVYWKDDDQVFGPGQASDAYLKLSKAGQRNLCLALREIRIVASSPHGLETLRELLEVRGRSLPMVPTGFNDDEIIAHVFLDHPDVWDEAMFFVRVENVPERNWHEYALAPDCPTINAKPVKEQIRKLEKAIAATWSRSYCGLGRHIEIDHRIRGGSVEYYLGEVSAYPRSLRECEGDEFVTRVSEEVRNIAVIFDRRSMMVRVGTSVPYVRVPAIADNWGRCIKGVKVVPARGENARTILARLADPTLVFTPNHESGILGARRRLIWVELFGEPGDAYAAKSGDRDALEKLVAFAKERNLRPDGYRILSAELLVEYRTPDGRRDVVAVSIAENKWRLMGRRLPSWLHDAVRERLVEWGLVHAVAA